MLKLFQQHMSDCTHVSWTCQRHFFIKHPHHFETLGQIFTPNPSYYQWHRKYKFACRNITFSFASKMSGYWLLLVRLVGWLGWSSWSGLVGVSQIYIGSGFVAGWKAWIGRNQRYSKRPSSKNNQLMKWRMNGLTILCKAQPSLWVMLKEKSHFDNLGRILKDMAKISNKWTRSEQVDLPLLVLASGCGSCMSKRCHSWWPFPVLCFD